MTTLKYNFWGRFVKCGIGSVAIGTVNMLGYAGLRPRATQIYNFIDLFYICLYSTWDLLTHEMLRLCVRFT
ncbi:hypothetical protein BKA59DRAFT_204446 [Fusarium tricinctum]|uniref:Uncharacterized protein n=1 Tax=Fusarium tricinctum TaxID=61284 RepID=A0A8K0RUS0_9HYPO|nr:hypothetical protein BKA59DRAFT_204446 [Fusarium tricinctum]